MLVPLVVTAGEGGRRSDEDEEQNWVGGAAVYEEVAGLHLGVDGRRTQPQISRPRIEGKPPVCVEKARSSAMRTIHAQAHASYVELTLG